ncbi:MAG TPA: hypothetical protein VFE63_11895 [Roseiarcus sp.]|nr:hypothetical protein [Roseiarcus sp.]
MFYLRPLDIRAFHQGAHPFFICTKDFDNPQGNAADNFAGVAVPSSPKRAIHPAGADAPARERNVVIVPPRSAHDGKWKQRAASANREVYSSEQGIYSREQGVDFERAAAAMPLGCATQRLPERLEALSRKSNAATKREASLAPFGAVATLCLRAGAHA